MLRVLIVDDDDMVRSGLKTYIDGEENLEVVAEASSGPQAVELAEIHKPHIVILDADEDGAEVCRRIRQNNPDVKVIMLTPVADRGVVFDSIRDGAVGYLIRGAARDDLIRSIRAVGEGQAFLPPQVAMQVLERVRSGPAEEDRVQEAPVSSDAGLGPGSPKDIADVLTSPPDQKPVADLVAAGLTNGEIFRQTPLPAKPPENKVVSLADRASDMKDAAAARTDPSPRVEVPNEPTAAPGSESLIDGRPEVAVLLPCHNEESTIGKVVRDFRESLPAATIYVYDNASTDRTGEVAAEAGAVWRRVPVLGKGNVLRRMFTEIDADVYVLADGDDTYQAEAAPRLVNRLLSHHLDMVVGLRTESAESGDAYRPGHRLGNMLLTKSVHCLFGTGSQDMLSGYRVFSRRYVKSFPAHSRGFETETEMTVYALDARLPYEEMPTEYRARPEESESKLRSIPDGIKILKFMLLLCKDYRPLMFFGSLTGVCLALALISFWLSGGDSFPSLLAGLSSVFAFLALLLETLSRSRKEMERIQYLAIPATAGHRFDLAAPSQSAGPYRQALSEAIQVREEKADAPPFGYRRKQPSGGAPGPRLDSGA